METKGAGKCGDGVRRLEGAYELDAEPSVDKATPVLEHDATRRGDADDGVLKGRVEAPTRN